MSFAEPDDGESHTGLSLVLAFLMLASLGVLTNSTQLGGEFAGIGALFVLPFCFGALMTLSTRSYSPLGCLVAPVVLGVISAALIALGAEGLVCVVMVMPFWFVAGIGGGLAALYMTRKKQREGSDDTRIRSVGLALLPFVLIGTEAWFPPQWETRNVTRSVVVDAEPGTIWPLLISIRNIEADEGKANFTQDWLGIPRPTDAQLVERDDETLRKARWGEDIRFEEIITEARPGHSMAWRFSFPDASLQNHTDRHISPDGEVLKIDSGRYNIARLADGRSRIALTTTYRMRTRLGWYFGWWGERLLGDVQANVLTIVKDRSETRGLPPPGNTTPPTSAC